jgi:hypothetical protein
MWFSSNQATKKSHRASVCSTAGLDWDFHFSSANALPAAKRKPTSTTKLCFARPARFLFKLYSPGPHGQHGRSPDFVPRGNFRVSILPSLHGFFVAMILPGLHSCAVSRAHLLLLSDIHPGLRDSPFASSFMGRLISWFFSITSGRPANGPPAI